MQHAQRPPRRCRRAARGPPPTWPIGTRVIEMRSVVFVQSITSAGRETVNKTVLQHRHATAACLAGTALAAVSAICGCQQWPHTWKNPFAADPPAYKASYGPTPRERMQSIYELAGRASAMRTEEKLATVQQLSDVLEREPDPSIRRVTVTTLASFDLPEVERCLQRALQDPSPDVRTVACRVCGQRAVTDDLTNLLHDRMLHDEAHEVRCAAVSALASLRTPASLQLAAQALRDRDPAIQVIAMNALQKTTGEDLGRDINAWLAHFQNQAPQEGGRSGPNQEIQLATAIGE